ALGSAGINNGGIRGVLLEHTGAARRIRNALDFAKAMARVVALINTGAGAGVNHDRIGAVHDDRKDVGIVDDAVVDRSPGSAAVVGFPRQVPGTGVDDIGGTGVNG